VEKLRFQKNTVQGTHGDYVAHSLATRRTYVISRDHVIAGDWLLQVFSTIAYPGGALSYDPADELDGHAASTKAALVFDANTMDSMVRQGVSA